jgi:hypothetical protein
MLILIIMCIKTKFYNQKVPSETKRKDVESAFKWATGLIDGDGHVGIEWTDAKKTKWAPLLKVSLHLSNARATYRLKKIFQCGKIGKSGSLITFRVRSQSHWRESLLPLWKKFPLRSSKYFDVLCVKYGLALNQLNQITKENKHMALINLKRQLKKNPCSYSYGALGISFSPCSSFLSLGRPSPVWYLKSALDLDWLAGFIEAEGCFYILKNGQHGFAIGQAYNTYIIEAIHAYFNVAAALKRRPNYTMLDTKNTMTLQLIAASINKRLLGMKSFEFTLWKRTLFKKNTFKSLKARQIISRVRKRT